MQETVFCARDIVLTPGLGQKPKTGFLFTNHNKTKLTNVILFHNYRSATWTKRSHLNSPLSTTEAAEQVTYVSREH